MPVLLFGGALNTLYMGLQLYVWVMLAMVLMLVGGNAIWYFFFDLPLKPLNGLFLAHIRNQQAAFTFDKNLHFVLKSEMRAKLIFDESVEDAKKSQKVWSYAPSGTIGKVQTDLVFDNARWTELGSPNREEIDKAVVLWNETNPDDEIHTLIRFGDLLQEGKIQCPIDKEIIIPWLRIRAAFLPKTIGSYAGYKRQLAKTLDSNTVANYNTMAYVILIFAGIVCIGMIAVKSLKLI